MSVGILTTKLVQDDPTRVYCGTEQEITGHVEVIFRKRYDIENAELFGPMEINVLLSGRSKTKIFVHHQRTTSTHRGRAPLLSIQKTIHSGPIRAAHNEKLIFPFSIAIPRHIQNMPSEHFDVEAPYDMSPDAPLPPSMTYRYTSGFMHHRFECFVAYAIKPIVTMPGIDVHILTHGVLEDGAAPITLEQPRVPRALANEAHIRRTAGTFVVRNQYLLPVDERPSGFKEKAKALLSSKQYPSLRASMGLNGSANIIIGESIIFELQIWPERFSMLPTNPYVKLKMVVMTLKALTQVRAEPGLLSKVRSQDSEKVQVHTGIITQTRPCTDGTGLARTITFRPVLDLPSTFSCKNIVRTYTISVEVYLHAAGVDEKFSFKGIPVRLLPPAIQDGTSAMVSGSSLAPVEEVLPLYEPPPPAFNEKDIQAEGSQAASAAGL